MYDTLLDPFRVFQYSYIHVYVTLYICMYICVHMCGMVLKVEEGDGRGETEKREKY